MNDIYKHPRIEVGKDSPLEVTPEEEHPAVEQAFRISLVWKQLSPFLSHQDLLTLALVSKTWNSHSRYLLREERKQLAKISRGNPCRILLKLNHLLLKTSTLSLPFYGLHIETYQPVYNQQAHQCLRGHQVEQLYPTLLNPFPWKCLKIDWNHKSSCGAVQLIIKLLQEKNRDLEHLAIYKLPEGLSLTKTLAPAPPEVPEVPEDWFRNLRTLEIAPKIDFADLIFAPELQEICGNISPEQLRQLLILKKGNLVKEFQLHVPSTTYVGSLGLHERTFLEFANAKPALRRLTLMLNRPLPPKAGEVVQRLLDLFSEKSSGTLEYFQGDLMGLVNFVEKDSGRSWPGLRTVKLDTGAVQIPQGVCLPLELAFGSANITRFELFGRNRRFGADDEDTFSYMEDPVRFISKVPLRSVRVLRLSHFQNSIEQQLVLLGKAFPNLTEIISEDLISCSIFWGLWPGLEYISITEASCVFKSDLGAIESSFFGVSLEEVMHLRTLEEDLRGFQLVPTSAGMRDLTSLKKLRISITQCTDLCKFNLYSPLPITTLMDQLVFQRMDGLRVEVSTKELYKDPGFSSVVEFKEAFPD